MNVGDYAPLHIVSESEKMLFTKAMHGMIGVKYEPLIVAIQLVAGTNYCFICNATISGNPTYPAQVTIFQPLPGKGDPFVVQIVRL